jgi:tetratricopeptide (TPR) repeat protein
VKKTFALFKSLIVLLLVFASLPAFPQQEIDLYEETPLLLHLAPSVDIPLGSSSELFTVGGSLAVTGELRLSNLPWLSVLGELSYALSPVSPFSSESFVSTISVGAGGRFQWRPSPRMRLFADALAGFYYGFMSGSESGTGYDPVLIGGIATSFKVAENLSVGVQARYRYNIELNSALQAGITTSFNVIPRNRLLKMMERPGPLEIPELLLYPVFPVFHKYYDNHSVGMIELHNPDKRPITELTVSFLAKQYMDTPKTSDPMEIEPGQRREVDLYALFTEHVLTITEGTKTATEIIVNYKIGNDSYRQVKTETLELYDRNAMTWDDDRRACAFVTAKDPNVMRFAKNVVGLLDTDPIKKALDPNLTKGILIHEALREYGISYVVDPDSSYANLSADAHAVDYLQFPRQSLEYKGGDCDDLSILYAALLEAVAVETAFITVPGHIYIALALEMDSETAMKEFSRSKDLIIQGEKVWVPVEVTERTGGFLKAWESGAQQWREHDSRGSAALYPIREGMKVYQPVGLPGSELSIEAPSNEVVAQSAREQLVAFAEREIEVAGAGLLVKMKQDPQDPRLYNKAGVLYARYGFIDRARQSFEKATAFGEYMPALLNLGNLEYLDENLEKAYQYYSRAYDSDPDNPKTILAMARINHRLENYGTATRLYAELEKMDSQLAARFSYLGLKGEDARRAADVRIVKETVIWSDE